MIEVMAIWHVFKIVKTGISEFAIEHISNTEFHNVPGTLGGARAIFLNLCAKIVMRSFEEKQKNNLNFVYLHKV